MTNKVPIEIKADLKLLYHHTAKKLRGSDRRQFMAQLVKQWGRGGYTFAEKELGWNQSLNYSQRDDGINSRFIYCR
jgi:hypothetical protein